jgi:hypothetical protein
LATLLSIRGDASEVNGASNGANVDPSVAPAGLRGKVVINGNGSLKFVPGGGVYFLNCCGNSNNAYFKFTGAAIGDIFDTSQGQVSFTLQSRSGFAQRQIAGVSERYSFAAMDANGDRFYFLTQIVAGALVFKYMVEGSEQSYVVPPGSEDRLFGSGVRLNIAVKWDGSIASLLLNGVVVKSAPYIPAAAQWNGTSRFYLGAHEHQGVGGHSVSDDIIGDFTVAAPTSSGKNKPRVVSSTWEVPPAADALNGKLSSPVELKELTCTDRTLRAGATAICQLAISSGIAAESAVIALTSGTADLLIPSRVVARAGDETVHFEVLVRPESVPGPATVSARSGENAITTELQISRSKGPQLIVANRQVATPGSVVEFEALAYDDLPYSLSISDLPLGATFDPTSAVFRWVPTRADLGMRALTFSATNALGFSTTATAEIHIVDTMDDQQPRILRVGGRGSDQALALHDSSEKLAAFPSAQFAAMPARPGDIVSIFASGLAVTEPSGARSVLVRVGNAYGRVYSIDRLDAAPDVYRIRVELPKLEPSLRTPISLVVTDAKGGTRMSEPAFIGAEKWP